MIIFHETPWSSLNNPKIDKPKIKHLKETTPNYSYEDISPKNIDQGPQATAKKTTKQPNQIGHLTQDLIQGIKSSEHNLPY